MAGVKHRCEKCGNRPIDGPIKRKKVKALGKEVVIWVCKDEEGCQRRVDSRR